MIVCSCFGITDGDLRDAMRTGQPAMAGTCCGSCLPLVSDLVRKLKEDDAKPSEPERAHRAPENNEPR